MRPPASDDVVVVVFFFFHSGGRFFPSCVHARGVLLAICSSVTVPSRAIDPSDVQILWWRGESVVLHILF